MKTTETSLRIEAVRARARQLPPDDSRRIQALAAAAEAHDALARVERALARAEWALSATFDDSDAQLRGGWSITRS